MSHWGGWRGHISKEPITFCCMKAIVQLLSISIFLTSHFSFLMSNRVDEHHELKGVMLDFGEFPTDCGYIAVALAVEFEVQEYSDVTFTKDTIVVIFNCPDFLGKDYFVVGNTYQLKLRPEEGDDSMYGIYNREALERNNQEEKLYVVLE